MHSMNVDAQHNLDILIVGNLFQKKKKKERKLAPNHYLSSFRKEE